MKKRLHFRKPFVALAIIWWSAGTCSVTGAVTRTWNKAGSGTFAFTNAANWDDGSTAFPNGIDDVAALDTLDFTANQSITLNQTITLGELRWADTVAAATTPATSFIPNFNNSGGTGALVFQVSSGTAKIKYGKTTGTSSQRNNSNINVPVTLNSDTEVILDLQSSTSRNLYFNTGSLHGSGNLIINAATRGTVAFFTDTYNLSNYTGTIQYTSTGAAGNFLQLAGNTGGPSTPRNLRQTTLEMSVATAGGSVSIFDAKDGAILELGALRGDGLLIPFTNLDVATVLSGTLRTGYLPGTNTYSGVISSTARFAGSSDPVNFHYEKVGAYSTQILSGANTYVGTTNVNAGTLLVNGTHTGGGQYTVNAPAGGDYNQNGIVDAADFALWRNDPNTYGGDPTGYETWRQNFGTGTGTLGGTGAISASVLVNPGAFIAPGSAGVGTLTVGGADIDGTLLIEYDGNLDTIDKLVSTDVLDITNTKVDFNNVAAGALNGGPHVIASYTSLFGTMFASVAELPAGYTIDYNYLSGNQIALVSSGSGASLESAAGVPEPTSCGLMLCAALGWFTFRRTRTNRGML